MYSFSITEQLVVFIESVGFGVLLGASYSIVDLAVSIFTVGRKKTVICDSIFSGLCAVALFCFILAYNLGKFRLYMSVGILVGVVVYFVSFGSYAQKLCSFILGGVHRFMSFVFTPLKRFFSWIRRRAERTFKNLKQKKAKKSAKPIANKNESVV
ncbi:MAG: spore cortex biosynthesis protein YabQ [Acutalibacteraceae bacterium]